MSKIHVVGDAIVITSSMKLEDLRTIERFHPKALTLFNEDKEPIFAIGTTTGRGSVCECGMSFGSESRDENKLATITICGRGIVGDPKEYIADTFGGAIANLNKLESKLPDVLTKIKAAKQAVMDGISVQ